MATTTHTPLNSSQVRLLKALAANPGLTRTELGDAAGAPASADNLGPTTKEALTDYPDSLYGQGMVRPTADEVERGGTKVTWSLTKKGQRAAASYVARNVTNAYKPPPKILDPLVIPIMRSRTYGIENWTDDDLEEIRSQLPHPYNKIDPEDLRRHALARRKQGAYANRAEDVLPEWYEAYRASPHFSSLRARTKRWLGSPSCTLNSAHADGLDLYHRTFTTPEGFSVLGKETPQDVIILCKQCYRRQARFLPKPPDTDPR